MTLGDRQDVKVQLLTNSFFFVFCFFSFFFFCCVTVLGVVIIVLLTHMFSVFVNFAIGIRKFFISVFAFDPTAAAQKYHIFPEQEFLSTASMHCADSTNEASLN